MVKAAREKKLKALLSMDRVVIDGKHYTIDTLPDDLDPKLLATPT